MQSSNNISGFSWYTGSANDNATSFGPVASIPVQPSTASHSSYDIKIDDGKSLPIDHLGDGTPITINAQNVYINEINEDGHHHINPIDKAEAKSTSVKETKLGDGTTQTAKSTSIVSNDGKSQTTTHSTETAVPKSADTVKKTETKTETKSENSNNPLGVPAPGSTKDATKSTTTSTNNPVGVPVPSHNAAPSGAVQPSTAPGASTTLNDGVHTTALSGTPASDKHDTKPPLSTSNPAPVLPHDADHPAAPTNDAKKSASKDKDKPHRSIKEKFHDWRMHRKTGGAVPGSDVHPKDSRDGKTLPSEEELAKYMDLGGESAIEKDGAGLPKDKLDSTGKSVTGSDANPSKGSNPFKAPTPAMKQAPVEAKAQ